MMTNAEFLKEVMLSDMSDEAKALALTVLTNSKENGCCVGGYRSARNGTKDGRVQFKAEMTACVLAAVANNNGTIRCKDIAKIYNEQMGIDPDAYNACSFIDVRGVTTKLCDEGILVRIYTKEKIKVTTCDWVNGGRVPLEKEILVDVPHFAFAQKFFD